MDVRQCFIDDCTRVVQSALSPERIRDLEVGLYNWALQHADTFRVVKAWNNHKFVDIYCTKARSILLNLDPTSYVGNAGEQGLLQRLIDGTLLPHDVPFLKPQEVFPDRWKEVVELKVQKDEYTATVKPVAMTDQFRCKRCKKRECVYRELQLRSADEPATIIVTCISCSHEWRIG